MRTTTRRRLRGGAGTRAAGAHRAPRRNAGGFTVVEYTVAMGIFSVVLAITMSGVAFMARDTVKTTNLSTATDQIRQAFTRLDRQVRYADNINRQGRNAALDRWYVEVRALDGAGVATCFQWRVDTVTHQVQSRQWAASPVPATITTGFTTVASDISNTTSEPPFTFVAATETRPVEGLDVMLVGRRKGADTAAVTLRTSLTARNSTGMSQTNADTEPDGNSDTPVCTTLSGGLNRP